MATDRQDISTAIVNRLLTVSSLHNQVFDYQVGEFTAFPTVCVLPAGHDEIIIDNGRDMRIYNFDITVYVERGKQGFGTARSETIRRKLEDDIMAVLDNYQQLGGTVLWARTKSGGWGFSAENGLSYFILSLSAYKAVSIS